MTMFVRRCLRLALALLSVLAIWSLLETMIQLRPRFSSYLGYLLTSGALFGLVWGAFLAAADELAVPGFYRRLTRPSLAALIGAAGGAIGFLLAQGLLVVLGDDLVANSIEISSYVVPISRAFGWAVLAATAAAASGIIARSPRRITIGLLGGFSGGLVGGALIEYARALFPTRPAVHLAGLGLFALLVVPALALAERRLSFGVVRVLNGPLRRNEYALDCRQILVGSDPRAEIPIPSPQAGSAGRTAGGSDWRYLGVAGIHVRIVARGRDVFLEPIAGSVSINDQRVGDRAEAASSEPHQSPQVQKLLRFDDVIACGGVKMLFRRA